MLRQIVPRLVAFASIFIAVGCGSAPPTHYYASGSNWAIYLAWTEDTAGHIQGQVQVIAADPNDPAKLKSTNAAFTGTRNGEDISIAFPLLSNALGATWTGTVANNAISLVIPTAGLPSNPTLIAGSFSDFQKAAQKVQVSVGAAQQQEAQQQAAIAQQQAAQQAAAEQQNQLNQQKNVAYNGASQAAGRVKEAYAQIQSALTDLGRKLPETPTPGGLRSQYAVEWIKMQGNWEKEQAAATVTPMTCYQKSTVSYIGTEVAYNLTEFNYLDTEAKDLGEGMLSDIKSANDGMDAVGQWAPELYQQAQTYSNLSGRPSTVPDPTASLDRLRKQTNDSINLYTQRIQGFETYVGSYDTRAEELNAKAKAFPESISCSG